MALPMLGILLVTSEWSQRTALTTFVLVPERHRLALANLLAATAVALLSLPTGLACAAMGNVLTVGRYPVPATVLYLAAPTGLDLVRAAVPDPGALTWLDPGAAMNPLVAGSLTGQDRQRLAVCATGWVVLPLAVGVACLRRREVA